MSLTSIFDNQARLLRTLQSILDQSQLPDAVFVHLSEEPYLEDSGFPHRTITDEDLASFLDRYGDLVQVRWVENTGPHRKLLPLLRELKDGGSSSEQTTKIITLDDDLAYHPEVITTLVESHAASACLRGFDMRVRPEAGVLNWKYDSRKRRYSGSSVFHFATGVGGVLFTLPVFEGLFDILLDEALYRECCPTNDDIWFNFLRIANEVPMTIIDAPYVTEDLTNRKRALWNRNRAANNHQIAATSKLLRQMGVL